MIFPSLWDFWSRPNSCPSKVLRNESSLENWDWTAQFTLSEAALLRRLQQLRRGMNAA
jgi:hypothetical protein